MKQIDTKALREAAEKANRAILLDRLEKLEAGFRLIYEQSVQPSVREVCNDALNGEQADETDSSGGRGC